MITTQYTLRLMSDAASETQLPASKYGYRGSKTESARTFFKTILAISRQVLENFGLPNVLILRVLGKLKLNNYWNVISGLFGTVR